MLTLSLPTWFHRGLTPINMRKSFDSLVALVRDERKHHPLSGSLCICSPRADHLMILLRPGRIPLQAPVGVEMVQNGPFDALLRSGPEASMVTPGSSVSIGPRPPETGHFQWSRSRSSPAHLPFGTVARCSRLPITGSGGFLPIRHFPHPSRYERAVQPAEHFGRVCVEHRVTHPQCVKQ